MIRKRIYIALSIIGYILPNYFVFRESMETGTFRQWLDPDVSLAALFANNITSTFTVDLIWVSIVFFIWIAFETKRLNIRRLYIFYLLTLFFGLAGTLPLFLYYREMALEGSKISHGD